MFGLAFSLAGQHLDKISGEKHLLVDIVEGIADDVGCSHDQKGNKYYSEDDGVGFAGMPHHVKLIAQENRYVAQHWLHVLILQFN